MRVSSAQAKISITIWAVAFVIAMAGSLCALTYAIVRVFC
jgi:hypothetical protein